MGLGSQPWLGSTSNVSDPDPWLSSTHFTTTPSQLPLSSKLLGVRIREHPCSRICQGLSLSYGSSNTVQPLE